MGRDAAAVCWVFSNFQSLCHVYIDDLHIDKITFGLSEWQLTLGETSKDIRRVFRLWSLLWLQTTWHNLNITTFGILRYINKLIQGGWDYRNSDFRNDAWLGRQPLYHSAESWNTAPVAWGVGNRGRQYKHMIGGLPQGSRQDLNTFIWQSSRVLEEKSEAFNIFLRYFLQAYQLLFENHLNFSCTVH